MNQQPKICVVVRKRPMSSKEISNNDQDIITKTSPNSLSIIEPRIKVDLTKYTEEHNFTFDHVFDENSSNEEIYITCIQPLVQAAFTQSKVTCFAYGQTGSGKTFTMMGESGIPGMYILAANDIYHIIQTHYPHVEVYVAFYEIYCEKLHDLLKGREIVYAREDAKQSVQIVGLSRNLVHNVESLMQVLAVGMAARTVGQTGANDESSRSHAVLEISLKEGRRLRGKMSFIDLAGSERGADVGNSDKQTRLDGAEINKSLLALKECIRALDQDKKHTPFRGSKLTQVLKDSFVGNCRTVMVANLSPCLSASENTLNTLRYADRVKEMKKAERSYQDPMMLPRAQPINQAKNPRQLKAPNQQSGIPGINQSRMPKFSAKRPVTQVQTRQKQIDTKQLASQHEMLIGKILAEEEDLIHSHRSMIDQMVELIKEEMEMLNEVDKPGNQLEQYVNQVDQILEIKQKLIGGLRMKVKAFRGHLEEESRISKLLESYID